MAEKDRRPGDGDDPRRGAGLRRRGAVPAGARAGSRPRHPPRGRALRGGHGRRWRPRPRWPGWTRRHAPRDSYGAQQVSGLWSWVQDQDHIEKAFDFSGMGRATGSPRRSSCRRDSPACTTCWAAPTTSCRRYPRSRSPRRWSPAWAPATSSRKPASRPSRWGSPTSRPWTPCSSSAASTAWAPTRWSGSSCTSPRTPSAS